MTASRNYVTFNRDSHLAGYYHNPVKGGMKKMDAYKRVARALVRVFFRDLNSLFKIDYLDSAEQKKKGDESHMANGISHCDKDHSNISPPSPIKNNTICVEKIKRETGEIDANAEAKAIAEKRNFSLDKAKTTTSRVLSRDCVSRLRSEALALSVTGFCWYTSRAG